MLRFLQLLTCGLILIFKNSVFASDIYGTFMIVKGNVQIQSKDSTKPTSAKVSSRVNVGDTIISSTDSRGKIVMSDRNVINISPDTKLILTTYENNPTTGAKNVEMQLVAGKVRNNVEQTYDGEKNKFQVKTPTAVAGVRGTQFVTSFDPGTQMTSVVTLKGAVTFATVSPKGDVVGAPVVVKKGESTSASPGAAPSTPKMVPKEELKKVDAESTSAKSTSESNSEKSDSSKKSEKSSDKTSDKSPDKNPESKAENKPDSKPEASADAKSDLKSEAKNETKTDDKPEAKSEAKSEAKTDAKPDAKSEAKPVESRETKVDSPTNREPASAPSSPANEMPQASAPAPGAQPKMIDTKDMDMGMVREIQNPTPAIAPPPPPTIPQVVALPPPPPTISPIVNDIIRNTKTKSNVIVRPVPQ